MTYIGTDGVEVSTNTTVYPELLGYRSRRSEIPPPKFPATCPICNAKTKSASMPNGYETIEYACGGMYEPKPQIQNHTDIWWGKCGK